MEEPAPTEPASSMQEGARVSAKRRRGKNFLFAKSTRKHKKRENATDANKPLKAHKTQKTQKKQQKRQKRAKSAKSAKSFASVVQGAYSNAFADD